MKESVVRDKTIEVKSNKDALANLKEDFTYFREHCIVIRRDFNTYHNLFDPDNFDLLEKISGTFFEEIHSILIRNGILDVCNLVDRESTQVKSKTRHNISIKLINTQIASQFEGDKCRKQIDSINTLTKNITDSGAPCYLTKFRDSCRRNSFTYAANRRCSSRPASATD